MLIALLSVTVLWSEIHSAFGFRKHPRCGMSPPRCRRGKLRTDNAGAVLHCYSGVYHHATPASAQLSPALLELALLQTSGFNSRHRGYAITTYHWHLLMLIGGSRGFDDRSTEWSKTA